MSLEQRSKKELVEIIREMKEKIKELKPVEAQQAADLSQFKSNAVGLIKDENGYYSLVFIKFDQETMAAGVESTRRIDTRDVAIVQYELNKYVAEQIMRKTRGGKYV